MNITRDRFCLKEKLELQREPFYRLTSFGQKCYKKLKKFTNVKSLHLRSNEFEESSTHCSFSALPDEIILKILKELDWRSLSCMSRINKRLNRLTQDHLLYVYLDVDFIYNTQITYYSNICAYTYGEILDYYASRCKYLQLLSLSTYNIKFSNDLIKFLNTCGKHLTHLRIMETGQCIDEFTMPKIVEICQQLKELNLFSSYEMKDDVFLCLENLQSLECLNLDGMYIKSEILCKILRRNRRMRHLHLTCRYVNIDMSNVVNVDDVAIELKNSCPDFEYIELRGIYYLTSQGIDALADCKNLQEVNFNFCGNSSDYGDSFHKLFSSCQRLEKINLERFHGFTDYDSEALTLCKNLKYLNMEGVTSLTTAICLKILLNCPKLIKISLSCNIREWNKTKNLLNQWIKKYNLYNLCVDLWPSVST